MSTLYERTGLPEGIGDAAVRQGRRFDDLGGVVDRLQRVDRTYERLGDATGIPTYHDLWQALRGQPERLEPWIDPPDPEPDADPEPEPDPDSDDGSAWWWAFGIAVGGYLVYRKLKGFDVEQAFDFEFDVPAWELDGIPWTVERTRIPGPQLAARVGDPLLHGGTATPGPGSADVRIGKRGALTIDHLVLACPMPSALGLPHLPHVGRTAWTTTNDSVLVNGQPLLRAGDWILETFGGPNPIVAGAPTVLAGPPGAPCVVREVQQFGLDELIPGLERVGWTGGKVSVKGMLRWNALEMVKTLGLGAAHAYGGPFGRAIAKALIGAVEGPSLEVEAEASVDWFADLFVEHDRDGDGVIDRILQGRVSGTSTAKAQTTVRLDPTNPTTARGEEPGELEFDTEFNRPELQGRKPGEPREPWKDETQE